ncbi:uncharacterized protein LOC131328488 [Rhododendron vialii]|uniref:uncharacterized protein LOC131328488 n=1 Tax=Rhododendron vialii TaxID=182163 RepID=UPI00265E44E9|nr:uncharacterized protein LOC131328488 [Rhododendron vialii]
MSSPPTRTLTDFEIKLLSFGSIRTVSFTEDHLPARICWSHTPTKYRASSKSFTPVTVVVTPWGMNVVGKLPVAPDGFKFLLTAIDYFSKWVEAEPLVTIEETDVIRFVWRNIISRFGVPFAIITDNGRQFTCQKYRSLLDEYGLN